MIKTVNRIKGNLWQGSLSGPLHVPGGPDLHIHCAYEAWPVESHAERTIWVQIDDAPTDWRHNRKWVEEVLDAAGQGVRYLDQGKTVVVNCFAGLNRSGLVTALILMLAHDMSADTAVATIRDRRSLHALGNRSFLQFLRAFDHERRRPPIQNARITL